MTLAEVADAREVSARPGGRTAALYRGTVAHHRFAPIVRTFRPHVFLAYLDVDALPEILDPLPFWSARRAAPLHFRRRDFFDGSDRPLGDAVRDLVEQRIARRPTGSIALLAHLRTFGWQFNPLAVYYCWTPDGAGLDAIVLEVTSTPWGERCWYVFDAAGGRTEGRSPKAMHVSPYLPMDVDYRLSWDEPGTELRLRLDVTRADAALFTAELALERVPLDRTHALTVPLRSPLMPLRVSAGIYGHAARLWLRRVPRFRHPAHRAREETK